MTTIADVIRRLRENAHCSVAPPVGLPVTRPGHAIPEDVLEFFRQTGGASLYAGRDYEFNVLAPGEIQQINVLLHCAVDAPDISDSWYAVVEDGNGDYLSVDFDESRLGRCYDSFHETHGLIGQTPVIARSFTELLARLLDNAGAYPYWLRDDFERLGDAYDDASSDPASRPE